MALHHASSPSFASPLVAVSPSSPSPASPSSSSSSPHELSRVELVHRVDVLLEQDANYDLAAAVLGRNQSLLMQLVSYLVAMLALTFQTDLSNSTHQLSIFALLALLYLFSDMITAVALRLLSLDSFRRPQMAVFIKFCVNTVLQFIAFVAVNVFRDNVIAPDSSVRLETIIPVAALLSWVYVEQLYHDTRVLASATAYAQIKRLASSSIPSPV